MRRVLLQLVLLIAVVAGSATVAAAQAAWSSVGSAGTVDEAAVGIYDTTGAQIRISPTAPLPATLVIRYNVGPIEGAVGSDPRLTIRFKDTGAGSRVVAVLKQVAFGTGATTTLLTADSNSAPSSPDFQLRAHSRCDLPLLNFDLNAYFVEATITQSSDVASLQPVKVSYVTCME